MKRTRPLLLLLVALAALVIGPVYAQSDMPKFLEIGTAGVGGAYYPIGIAMADILTKNLKTRATAQVTGGAVANIQLIENDEVDIAITQAATAFKARQGMEPFTSVNDKVCGLFGNLTQGVFQIAVRPGANIHSLQDLKGKRVSLGPAGGLGVELAGYVFEAAGFSIDDVRATYISYDESATAMADGNLDAIVIQTALPTPALAQLQATRKPFDMLTLPQDVIQGVIADRPYYSAITIPADVYGTKEGIDTLFGANMVIVDCSLPDDVVYSITKALFENIDAIRVSQPAAKELTLEAAPNIPIDLHPGAARYFREVGVLN